MNRFWAGLIVVCIVLGSAAGGIILVRQAKAHDVPLFYVLGPLVVAIGIGFSALHLSVSDAYLRQHFGGDENAKRMREMWRGGWLGALIGLALIAVQYFFGSYIPLP
jgi:cation transporter-like permease